MALLSEEQAARPDALTGGMSQEAKAPGNSGDRLTWDRRTRRHRDRMRLGFRHTLQSRVVKTGRQSSSDSADAKLRERAIAHNEVPVTEARVTEEPDEGKALMSGSVVAVRGATPSPTITQADTAPRSGFGAKIGYVMRLDLGPISVNSRRG
jgi:hypothetical protein